MVFSRANWPLAKTQIFPVLIVFFLALAAIIFEQNIQQNLVYQRTAITNGEYWRLFSGHFFHTNLNHFLLNCAGLFLLWSLHGQYFNWRSYSLLFLFSALSISIGIYFFTPELTQYVGLSGVLHGFFIVGAWQDIRHKFNSGYLLLAAIIIKITHEQLYGASAEISSFINANVAIDAHLWGAIAGTAFFLLWLIFQRMYFAPNADKNEWIDK